jgi:hypothetical protein
MLELGWGSKERPERSGSAGTVDKTAERLVLGESLLSEGKGDGAACLFLASEGKSRFDWVGLCRSGN